MRDPVHWEGEEADADCRRTFKCTTCLQDQHIDMLEDFESTICRDCCGEYAERMVIYWNTPFRRMH